MQMTTAFLFIVWVLSLYQSEPSLEHFTTNIRISYKVITPSLTELMDNLPFSPYSASILCLTRYSNYIPNLKVE